MTINKILKPTSTIIEWCKVLEGTETVSIDGYYPSNGYDFEVELSIVRKELSKFFNIPKVFPIGNGKKNYLLHKKNKNVVLFNSGSKNFQILIKFTDEYQSFREKRKKEEKLSRERENKKAKKRLERYTGKILFSWKEWDVGVNHYDSQEEINLITIKDGKKVDTLEVYSRDFSSNSDIYIVVKHGKPSVSDIEIGSKEDIPCSDNYISIEDGYFSTDLGYWEVVKKWWDELTV